MNELLIVDSFAGGGGASLGIEMALGRSPDVAINHDAEAIALHRANHPTSRHYQEDVWRVDPVEATRGRPVGLMWLSPDCKHFSKAKGGKPVSKRVRGLAWVAVRWAEAVRPRVIVLENVEEFQTWGPVLEDGRPCPDRKGKTFRAFVRKLERLGYAVAWRELRACDYGAPTIRKRLFLIARCDGQPIAWPTPTHGKGRALPWRTAAECIDWSIACPSIFLPPDEARAIGVRRPLAEATLRRIARGLQRFVLDNPEPFIVPMQHMNRPTSLDEPLQTITTQGNKFNVVTPYVVPVSHGGDARTHSVDEPLRTITGSSRSTHALVAPTLIQTGYGEHATQRPRAPGLDKPLGTVVAGGAKHALVSAFLAKHFGDRGQRPGSELSEPVSTITAYDHNALVASHLVKLKGTSRDGQQLTLPLHTVQAGGLHYGEVRAFLVAYFGNEKDGGVLDEPMRTVTSRDRFGLVTVEGELYEIADIGMRMLAPRELYRAQGFPDSYRIDIEFNGKPLTKTAQVRMCGNSVAPPIAEAIVRANLGDLQSV